MKKFKINYLVRFWSSVNGQVTHSHSFMVWRFENKEHSQKMAMDRLAACIDTDNVKSIEIGEIEEVTNEG